MTKSQRRLIGIVVGILLLIGGYFGMKFLTAQKPEPPVRQEQVRRKKVETKAISNQAVSTKLDVQGRLQAFNKIGLFSEVTGTLKATGRPFKVGTYFPKGAPLLRIDDTETRLSLQAQKATLLNSIAMMMPDLKIDYPASFEKWDSYLAEFNVDAPIKELPEADNRSEKLFVSGRNLYTQYYNIKSVEERLSKFVIPAPFSGVLTSSNIDVGAVVRTGQQIGELMATGSYELVATVPLSQLDFLKTGGKVQLRSEDIQGNWTGTIKRISDQIDPGSQTVEVFIGVSGENLREGMYLRGEADAKTLADAVEIDRNLLIDQRAVYTLVQDTILQLTPVNVLKYDRETVVVSGLADGTNLVTNTIAGAYDGMFVEKSE
ncbi:HlyD family secretion protein [Lewinellaceae bacterium SD302]|nr:HlyD family secretion protein [Lewinellaceae bacterium SD302]